MTTRDGEKIRLVGDGYVLTETTDFIYSYTATQRSVMIKRRRPSITPGRFWARSSAGVYMNAHRRRMNGY